MLLISSLEFNVLKELPIEFSEIRPVSKIFVKTLSCASTATNLYDNRASEHGNKKKCRCLHCGAYRGLLIVFLPFGHTDLFLSAHQSLTQSQFSGLSIPGTSSLSYFFKFIMSIGVLLACATIVNSSTYFKVTLQFTFRNGGLFFMAITTSTCLLRRST